MTAATMTTAITIVGLLQRLPPLRWPEESQLGSRRNALVAATALAEARRQHREVEEFLELHAQSRLAVRSSRAASAGAT